MPPLHRTRRAAVASVVGVSVAASAAALVTTRALPGPALLGAALVLGLAVPTSRLLARRILWHGAVLAGVVPALWWVDLPVGALGRFGLLVALTSGGLAAWLVAGGRSELPGRARRLVPAWQVADLVPAGAVAAAAYYLFGWLRVTSPTAALAALMPGWDHSAHFAMAHALRLHGATADMVPAPDDGTWAFAAYPQGHHAVVATLMEALTGTDATDVGAEMVAYLHGTSLVLVGAAAMVAAGLCALPRLRRRPAVATPVAALAVAAVVIGPGGASFSHGFVNFVVAAALTACVPLVVATMPRVTSPAPLAALGGLVVGVAHGWALLLVMALPMAAVVALPVRRARWRADRRTWWACGAIAGATAAGLAAAARVVLSQDVGAVLVASGGVVGPDMGVLALVVTGAVGAALWGATRVSTRVTWAAAGPLVGLAAAGVLAVVQLRATGDVSYYFWKLLIGVELVCAVLLGLVTARRVTAPQPGRTHAGRLRVAAASLGIAAGASQVFGVTLLGSELYDVPPTALEPAAAILGAVDVALATGGTTVSLTTHDGDAVGALNAQQWHLALTGAWTVRANEAATAQMATVAAGGQDLVDAARLWLADPLVRIITTPGTAERLRAELPTDEAGRILSW